MADEETSEETTEETEETTEETDEGGDNANWTRMGDLVRGIVKEELKSWRPPAGQSKKSPPPGAKKSQPTRGAFTEWFRKGLSE